MAEMLIQEAPVATGEFTFRGLQAYREEDASRFFGRDEETEELYQLIRSNTVTIVFGKSGTGKTSLLNAGVFPKLREDDCLPFRIRLEFAENSPALMTQIMQVIRMQIDKYGFKVGPMGPGETLWEFFHREHLWRIVTPVLIFDQFEEIFTLAGKYPAKKEEVDLLMAELSDLIENNIPGSVKEKYMREGRQIAFDYREAKAKILFAFREDFLPEMESVTKEIPSVKHSRFRLKPMNGQQAFDVIIRTWRGIIDNTEAKRIVYYLTNETETESLETEFSYGKFHLLEIEPSLLSQVCAYLDKERLSLGLDKISADFLSRYPKGIILSAIYHQALEESNAVLTDKADSSVPAGKNVLQEFIEENLVTEEGYRTRLDVKEIHPEIEPGIRMLKQKYFIREEGKSVELTHDVIATIVKSDKDKRRTALAVAQANARARRKAIRIIVGATIIALGAWGYSAFLTSQEMKHAEEIRDEYKLLEKKRDSLANAPIVRPELPGRKKQELTALDSMRNRIRADSARLAMIQEERDLAHSHIGQLEVLSSTQKKLIREREDSIRSLVMRKRSLELKKDYYRMYQSHIDSIFKFNKDTGQLQYHIGLIKKHQSAFRDKLN